MYILHAKQWAAYNAAAEQPISAYLGGIRSGKTICGAHVAYRFIMERPDEIGAIFSNTHKQLTKATLREFKKVLAFYNVYEGGDKHYVTNKNPEKFFGYKSMFPDHDGVWSFCNGAQVFCFSLEMQIRGTEFGWAWGDEIQEATRDSLNVVLGRMSGSARGARTFYTLTPPRSNPEIDKLIWGKGHIPITTGTTLDNDSFSENMASKFIFKFVDCYEISLMCPPDGDKRKTGKFTLSIPVKACSDSDYSVSLPPRPERLLILLFGVRYCCWCLNRGWGMRRCLRNLSGRIVDN